MAISFKGAHFPQEIILTCVRWYVAYTVSSHYSNASIYRQLSSPDFLAFDLIFSPPGPIFKARLRRKNTWRVD